MSTKREGNGIVTDMRIDAEAVLWSASEADRVDRPLLIVMHGRGSNESDLFSLAPYLPLEPVIASLRAPVVSAWPLDGWSWFENGGPGDPDSESADAATLAVLDWLDSLDVQPTSVGLLGFSQGGAMTLQLLRHAPERFAYAVNLSGFVVRGALPGDARLAELRPPVFWARGVLDEVIPDVTIERTTDWLPGHSTLSGRIYENLAHAVSQQELADIRAFIERQL